MKEQDEIILADDMSEHPVTPELEQEIVNLVAKQVNAAIEQRVMIEDPDQNQLIAAPSRLAMEKELERRKAIYRALLLGYRIEEFKFNQIPKAEPVKPNPNKQKQQPQLSPEEKRRYDRIKKSLKRK